MDPNAIAQQFIGAYVGFLTTGNVAGLTSLYGEDSVCIYDGTVARGQAQIAATFINPRLPGGVKARVSGFSAQGTATNHLLVTLDGEYDKPPGHFHQAILLSPTASGGMYIRADIARWGAGSAAQQMTTDTTGLTMPFLQNYYGEYTKAPRDAICNLYHPQKSQVSMGDTFKFPPSVGRAAIEVLHRGTAATAEEAAKPPRLPPGTPALQTIDGLSIIDPSKPPVNGITSALLILVTGSIRTEGEANALNYMHVFLVATEAGSNYVANELFGLIYA